MSFTSWAAASDFAGLTENRVCEKFGFGLRRISKTNTADMKFRLPIIKTYVIFSLQ